MSKQPKLEVVSAAKERQESRQKAAEFLKKKLEAKRQEVSEKLYAVSCGLNVAKSLRTFIQKEAQWKFTESLGIIEANRVLEEQVNGLQAKVKTELELGALTIEAIYYFLTKEEGKGIAKATSYVNDLLRPISESLNASKTDRESINQMEKDLATLEDAIHNRVNFEGEDKLLSEIEKEISEEMNKKNEKIDE